MHFKQRNLSISLLFSCKSFLTCRKSGFYGMMEERLDCGKGEKVMLDNRVETFLALCEKMNYTKTAETLHITQPAVTQQIRWLEEYYGCRLFSYQGKVLRLTEKGEALRRFAQQMTANARGIIREMEREENTEIHLRIGATKTIGDYMLPSIMVDFLRENPQYRLHLTVDNTGKLLHLMEEGKIDFAIVEGFFDKEKYDFTLYKRERFLGVCGKNCSLRGKTISLWETRSEPLILREQGSGTRDILEELLKENNFTVHSYDVVQEISNFQAIKAMTEANLGITFLYEPVVKQELEEGKLFPLRILHFDIFRELNFVYLQNSLFRQVCQPFVDFAVNRKK